MYFRVNLRVNPATGKSEGYYRLIESYRNENNRVCHRNLLTLGFIDFDADILQKTQILLNDRLHRRASLFEETDNQVLSLTDDCWQKLIKSKKIDVSDMAFEKEKRMIDTQTLKHENVREVGAEWLCFQAINQLKIQDLLASNGWKEEQINLAITQIISRAVYPYSENRTSRLIKENSAVCELTGYNLAKITKDKLYKSALDLYNIKDQLEQHLSHKTNELFALEDKIVLYDLTNTYFEGRKINSNLAKFGRSKEKRSDCKLVVLALVVNIQGFIKFSNIFEGNTTDSKSLPDIIDKIKLTTHGNKRAIVVMDAGIATKENCEILSQKGYDYVCVSRSKIKDYTINTDREAIEVSTQNGHKITLNKVVSEQETDYILKVNSPGKRYKEMGMKMQFEERFLFEIEKINASVSKKNGIKLLDKVNQRIGKAQSKYASMNKYYDINVIYENNIVKEVKASKTSKYDQLTEELGVYFIRTSLQAKEENLIWDIYNSIREIESCFRCLKNDLDLRPIYHKNDDATMAHLHLGILAYWLVNTLRFQLKAGGVNHDWQEIVRISSTQKMITTIGKNKFDEVIKVRKCSMANESLSRLYKILRYKPQAFIRKKSVVHKTET
jgi:Transposase DDE domain